jgi:hypothetical protein
MMRRAALALSATLIAAPALAQTPAAPAPVAPAAAKPAAAPKVANSPFKPVTGVTPTMPAMPPKPLTPEQRQEQALLNTAIPGKDGVKRLVVMRGLDKITGRPSNILVPVGVPVNFATMTITARYCYSTPPSEPPETTAFLQIEDHRPDQDARAVFSGWMLASSPSLNGLQHPLYDAWVINCATNQPGQILPTIASTSAVKETSPDATSKEAMPDLPEGAGQ